MKKFIALLLVMAVLLTAIVCALAEVAEPAHGTGPVVDLTGALVAFVMVVFDFLLAWIARVIIPPIKSWLVTHTTEKQRGLVWDAICKLVDAAEQVIRGPGMGEKRLAYVEAGLQQRGIAIDNDLIEAAVRRMKQNTRITFADAFDINTGELAPVPLTEDGEPDLEVDHWSLEQLRGFFKLNGFDETGLVTREDYLGWLDRAASQEPEEPQSAVE